MSVSNSIFCKSLSFNGTTYDASGGGLIYVEYEHSCDLIEDRVADQKYPVYVGACNHGLTVRARIRDVRIVTVPGAASSNIVAIVKGDAEYTITFATMVLQSARGLQESNGLGSGEMAWRHKSADGSTSPVS